MIKCWILKQLHLKYGIENLCLGGGCAYNGLANGKIYNKTGFKHVWIPPAPSDAGSAIGAVVHYLVKERKVRSKITRNPFLGPEYYLDDIRHAIGIRSFKKFESENKLRSYNTISSIIWSKVI